MGTATWAGMAIGLFVQIYSNACRKLPMSRHPWEHLLFMGLGAGACNGLVKFDEVMAVELEKKLAAIEKMNAAMPNLHKK